MDISVFFLKKDKFLSRINKEKLLLYAEDKFFSSEKRLQEYCMGRFLVKNVLQTEYGINNPTLIIKNKKPMITDESIHFSISHSNNIVLCSFANAPIGADIEYMKNRDFSALRERFNIHCNGNEKESFYEFWTKYEAEIKLQNTPKNFFTQKVFDEYMLTLCSTELINKIDINEYCLIPE